MNVFDIAHERRKIITKSIYNAKETKYPMKYWAKLGENKSLYINLQNTEEAACPGIESAV